MLTLAIQERYGMDWYTWDSQPTWWQEAAREKFKIECRLAAKAAEGK